MVDWVEDRSGGRYDAEACWMAWGTITFEGPDGKEETDLYLRVEEVDRGELRSRTRAAAHCSAGTSRLVKRMPASVAPPSLMACVKPSVRRNPNARLRPLP